MLGDDYFRHDPARHALIGSRTGQMHRLGDVVTVRLVEAAPLAGALRFELMSETAPRQTRPNSAKAKRQARRDIRPDRGSPQARRADSKAAKR
jgi:ribonuclease R